jgi:flagellar basal body-associated protein FliL
MPAPFSGYVKASWRRKESLILGFVFMKQKAQIDILDLPLIEGDEVAEDITSENEKPPLQEVKKDNRNKNRLYLIVSLVIIIIGTAISAGYYVWFHKSEKKATIPVAATGTPGQKSFMAVLGEFNVDVKDDKGNIRMLSCGFLLEMEPNEDGKSLESRIDVRKLIFDTLHKRKVGDLISNNEKKAIKKEITEGVNGLLGAGKVKETYITKFVLL